MANDTPDWGGQYVTTTFFPLFDMGELAVRIGSPVIHDRRGAVVWQHDFETGLPPWSQTLVGAGSAITLDADTPETGAFQAKLTAGTTNPSQAYITKNISTPLDLRMGVSASIDFSTGVDFVYLRLFRAIETGIYQAEMRIDTVNRDLQIVTPGDVWVTIDSNVGAQRYSGVHRLMKLVADFNTNHYTRCIFVDTEYDISAYQPDFFAVSTLPYSTVEIEHRNTLGVAAPIYVDSVVITAAEPANA